MPGVKGKIIQSKKGESVYLSDRLALWKQGEAFHITKIYKNSSTQQVNIAVSKNDGLLYDILGLLHKIGLHQF